MIPLWSFVAVTVPLVLTPGASTAVVLRNSLGGGTRAGLVTAIGVNADSLCYGLLTAFGLSIALRRWPMAWPLLRFGGACYLAWLGSQSLWRARRATAAVPALAVSGASRSRWRNLYEGFLTNILNPAIGAFYLVLLPQFIPAGAPVVGSALILTTVHIALAATWHVLWATAGGGLSRTLAAGRPRQFLDALAGGALVGLAVKLAVG